MSATQVPMLENGNNLAEHSPARSDDEHSSNNSLSASYGSGIIIIQKYTPSQKEIDQLFSIFSRGITDPDNQEIQYSIFYQAALNERLLSLDDLDLTSLEVQPEVLSLITQIMEHVAANP